MILPAQSAERMAEPKATYRVIFCLRMRALRVSEEAVVERVEDATEEAESRRRRGVRVSAMIAVVRGRRTMTGKDDGRCRLYVSLILFVRYAIEESKSMKNIS